MTLKRWQRIADSLDAHRPRIVDGRVDCSCGWVSPSQFPGEDLAEFHAHLAREIDLDLLSHR